MFEPDASQLQEFQEFTESMAYCLAVLSEFTRTMAEVTAPSFRSVLSVFILVSSRHGLYNWLARRIGYNRVAWWIAWRLPDSLILRLPLG